MIKLIAGLGNPGKDYQAHRHNAGFWFIESLANNLDSKFSSQSKFFGETTTCLIGTNKVRLLKTKTFMNNSGICIRELIEYFKIDAQNVIVFHDDLDIDFGKIKTKFGGSSAGHNGIESIDRFIGKDYSRVRIGIGKPKTKIAVTDHVLKDFDEDEKEELKKITGSIIKSLSILLDKKLDLFSSTVNDK